MHAGRDQDRMEPTVARQETPQLRTWTAPVVTLLRAGAAEDGLNNTPDGGQDS